MQIVYHVAASSDGFIARPDGDVSWLEESDIDIEETGLTEFMAEVDGIVMGRHTYDFVERFGVWPYGETPAWICTRHDLQPLPNATLYATDSISDVMSDAQKLGVKKMWLVGGGQLASAFLDRNLITEICMTQLPVQLTEGIALFAQHALEEIPHRSKSVVAKNGFDSITIHL